MAKKSIKGAAYSKNRMNGFNGLDPILLNQMEKLFDKVNNSTLSLTRANLQHKFDGDDRRSINDECGYPDALVTTDYKNLYERESVAARVVEVLPQESWKIQPDVFETQDAENITEFEQGVIDLNQSLRNAGGTPSWFRGNIGSPIWEALQRVDELSGIGRYGVLLFGFDDGKDLSEPVDGVVEVGSMPGALNAKSSEDKRGYSLDPPYKLTVNAKHSMHLMYTREFDEVDVSIVTYENNKTSPRFGLPVTYSVNFSSQEIPGNENLRTSYVHWTRILHVADNLGSSRLFGAPRMRPVYNRLYDLRKIYGGDAEAYWKNMLMKLFLETHPQLGGDVEIDSSNMKDQMEQFWNGLQQWMALSGMHANVVSPEVVDPKPHVEIQLEAICIRLGIPLRIFKGSERGELASSQDSDTWDDRLVYRRNMYLIPRIVCPFFDRLILVGVLPMPGEDGYTVVWPDPDNVSANDKSNNLFKRTQSMAAYSQGDVEALMTPMDYLTREMGYTDEEAQQIIDNRMDEPLPEPEPIDVSAPPAPIDESEESEEGN